MDRESWVGVEFRHLTALEAVAREGSFRAAADRLGYVQSAVSQQVAGLERLVGVRLVERFRGSKEVSLTEAGELLVAHFEQILAQLHAARADLIAHVNGGDSTTLRLGICHQSIGGGLLADLLRRLADAAPEVRVDPVEAGDDHALSDLLEQGAVDLALADFVLDAARYESHEVLSDPCALWVRSDSEWLDRSPPATTEELARLPLIALEGWRFLSIVEARFASDGLAPNFVASARSEATARALVAAGLGAAIVPALGADRPGDAGGHPDRISAIELEGLLPLRRVALHWPVGRRNQPGLNALLEVADAIHRTVREGRRARAGSDERQTRAEAQEAPPALAAA